VDELSFGKKGSSGKAEAQRLGRELTLEWTHGDLYHDVITATWAPPLWTFTVLVQKQIPINKDVYIYGYYINTEEANRFWLVWNLKSTFYVNELSVPGKGGIFYIDNVPVNIGYPARKMASDDPAYTYVAIYATTANANITYYQAGILTAEEDTASSEGEMF
jgi:hypothetical protein